MTCVFTVDSSITSAAAISAFERPRATSSSTSRSRGVRRLETFANARLAGRLARDAVDHASRHRPVTAARPGRDGLDRADQLLRRRALEQEARRADRQRAEDVLVVLERRQDHDPASGAAATTSRVAAIPSRPGMRMSIRTTSGRSSRAAASRGRRPRPHRPPPPSSSLESTAARPARMRSSSSTSSTRTVGRHCSSRP